MFSSIKGVAKWVKGGIVPGTWGFGRTVSKQVKQIHANCTPINDAKKIEKIFFCR